MRYKNNHGGNMSSLHKDTNGKLKSNNKFIYLKLILQLFTVLLIVVVTYGIFLDRKISSRIDGKVWQLPAAVYGRIVNLEPDMSINKQEMVKLLKITQYRQVSKLIKPGEFIVKENSIEMIRRPFDFPESKDGSVNVRLIFNNDRLESIENTNTNRQFSFLHLDPRLITMISSSNGEQRLFVARNGFQDLLIDTLLATEDRHFYEHDGVSFYSIVRAVLVNIIAGHKVQGASTLTQQLVKNLFLSNKRSYWRKINELYMAMIMDARYSKDRILELYMNEVYLGQSGNNEIRGFPLASLFYFGRPVEELSLDQQALLVGMIKGASIYNPWRNPKLALERRNLVLKLLLHQRIINQNLYNILTLRPLGVQQRDNTITQQPAFMQVVRQELQEKIGDKVKDLSGVKIFTTFDPIAQYAAEKAAVSGIWMLKKKYKLKDLETAIVVVDRYSGEIRAIVGSSKPQYAGYNRAIQARRSIGSLAKPTIYLTALSHPDKYRLNTWIEDDPIYLRQPDGKIWSPQNNDRQFNGQVMLVDALIRSMNVPTVNLGMTLGLPAIIDTWQKLGISKNQLHPVPAMILGALNLTPIEVAQAFQTIASGGNCAPLSSLRSVIAEDGKILYQSYPQAKRAIPEQATYMTLWAMQQIVQHGTGRQLGVRYPNLHLAGKTGTTNNNVDTWFAGIDGREVVITWVGRDNNQPTKLYGSSGAMSIYQRYLGYQSPIPLSLIPPEDIFALKINNIGEFTCDNDDNLRLLPVWITNKELELLCSHNLNDQSNDTKQSQLQYQNQNKEKNTENIETWIRDMFG